MGIQEEIKAIENQTKEIREIRNDINDLFKDLK